MFKYAAKPVQRTNGTTSSRLEPDTVAAVIMANIHDNISTSGAMILGPHVLSGSQAQQATSVAMNKPSASFPDIYHASPVVTYSNGQTMPKTQLGGASGTRSSTLCILPQIADDRTDAVEMTRPGARSRNAIFYLIRSMDFRQMFS